MSASGPDRRTSTKDDWGTPLPLFKALDVQWKFTLDVCASDWNAKCGRFFGPEDDGLTINWGVNQVCWMNPPYSEVYPWVAKAVAEVDKGNTTVALLPNNTDNRWWHDYVCGPGGIYEWVGELVFIRGRIAFIDPGTRRPKTGNTGGSVIVVFGKGSGQVRSMNKSGSLED